MRAWAQPLHLPGVPPRRRAPCSLEQRGPAALRVRDVASAAGQSMMGVYTHFGSKPGLLEQLYLLGFGAARGLGERALARRARAELLAFAPGLPRVRARQRGALPPDVRAGHPRLRPVRRQPPGGTREAFEMLAGRGLHVEARGRRPGDGRAPGLGCDARPRQHRADAQEVGRCAGLAPPRGSRRRTSLRPSGCSSTGSTDAKFRVGPRCAPDAGARACSQPDRGVHGTGRTGRSEHEARHCGDRDHRTGHDRLATRRRCRGEARVRTVLRRGDGDGRRLRARARQGREGPAERHVHGPRSAVRRR